MNKEIQKSLVNTVKNIVDNKEICEECIHSQLAEHFETCLEAFEETFDIKLTEEQEDILIDVGLNHILLKKESKNINLTEDIQTIINNNSPQDVFCQLVEEQSDYLRRLIQLANERRKTGNLRRSQTPDSARPESTTDPFSNLSRQIERSQIIPPRLPRTEDLTEQLKKKKKVYKIIFVDKGVKKKGTAVSHKGVMRIVHGKQHFKVFDQNNRDVSSEFKS